LAVKPALKRAKQIKELAVDCKTFEVASPAYRIKGLALQTALTWGFEAKGLSALLQTPEFA
jgi:hypothetical protein